MASRHVCSINQCNLQYSSVKSWRTSAATFLKSSWRARLIAEYSEKKRCSFWVNHKLKIINKLQYVHTFCFIALFISLWWILLLWCSRVINLKVCFWSELLYCNSSPLLMNYLNNFVTNPCNERFKSLSLISTERFYEK